VQAASEQMFSSRKSTRFVQKACKKAEMKMRRVNLCAISLKYHIFLLNNSNKRALLRLMGQTKRHGWQVTKQS
jgi:hypothetical protein